MFERRLQVVLVAVALLAPFSSGCCGAPIQPDHRLYEEIDTPKFLSKPVSVAAEPTMTISELGVVPGKKTLPAGTKVTIENIRETGLVTYSESSTCNEHCSVTVRLGYSHHRGPNFDEVFVDDDPLADVDDERREYIEAHEVVEGMSSSEVLMALGSPKHRSEDVRGDDPDAPKVQIWEYPDRAVHIADERVVNVVDSQAESTAQFQRRCGA